MVDARRNWMISAAAFAVALAVCGVGYASSAQNARNDEKSKKGLYLVKGADGGVDTEVATFGAGCFWGVEDWFRKFPGVTATAVGYSGGHTEKPTYKEVCNDGTGHAEVVQLEFDPKKVSYEKIVEEFFFIHDPTTLNRQGPDEGTQYRSAIYYHSEAQKKTAEAARAKLQKSGELDAPIVTEITKASTFWAAEGYHQQYVEKGGYASCHPRRERKH